MNLKLAQAGMLSIANRWKFDAPRTRVLKNSMGRCQAALHGVLSKREANARRTELSAEGIRAENRKGLTDAFTEILRSTRTAAAFNAKLGQWDARNKAIPTPDKTDVVAAVRRSEDRAVLRSLPIGERLGAALKDPVVLLAALEGSDLASGLTPETRRVLVDHFVSSDPARAKVAAEIAEAREAVDSLTATVDFLRAAVGTAGEFKSPVEFNSTMESAIGDRAANIVGEAERAVDAMAL